MTIRNIKSLHILLYIVATATAAALLAGCASIGNPSGGRRDETPPRLLRARPADGSLNFNGNRIVLDFDEYVNVKDPTTSVVISPPGDAMPRVSAQGRRVSVNFTDSLLPNTTYTIDFGSAIEDNNEGNKLENFSYSFSTGDHIDSLRIAGMVLSAEALEPMQRKIVGVHSNLADSALTKLKFDRVARTDDRGRFSIEGLAPGKYRLFALDDVDGNYRYSSPDEEMAFYDLVIEPSVTEAETVDSIFNLKKETLDTVVTRRRTVYLPNDILLRSSLTDRRQQYIKSYARVDSTRLDIFFGAPQKSMPRIRIVGAPDLQDWYAAERSRTNDSISLWITRPSIIKTDTLRLAIDYLQLDSLNNYVNKSDTLRFTTDRPRNVAKKEKKRKDKEEADSVVPPTVHLALDFVSPSTLEIGAPILLRAASPLASIDTTRFHLEVKQDTLWKPYPFRGPTAADSLNPRLLKIDFKSDYGKELRLRVDTIALTGVYGLHTAPAESSFKIKELNDYSSLKVIVSGLPAGMPAFVELLESADKISRRATVNDNLATFPNLNPGKYYMRLYFDYNGNCRFDPADYHIGRQPDQAFYYPKAINVKKNWEKEEHWDILALPMDKQKPDVLLKNKPELRKGEKTKREESDEEDEDDLDPFGGHTNIGNRKPNMNSGSFRHL